MRFMVMHLGRLTRDDLTCSVCGRADRPMVMYGNPPIVNVAGKTVTPPQAPLFCEQCSEPLGLKQGQIVSDERIDAWRAERGLAPREW